jgi:hypothetical protein
MINLTQDIRNIIDAKVANGDVNVTAEVLKSFAAVLSGFADAERDDENDDDADRLTEVSDALTNLAAHYS